MYVGVCAVKNKAVYCLLVENCHENRSVLEFMFLKKSGESAVESYSLLFYLLHGPTRGVRTLR